MKSSSLLSYVDDVDGGGGEDADEYYVARQKHTGVHYAYSSVKRME
jgi:hypothetical protein